MRLLVRDRAERLSDMNLVIAATLSSGKDGEGKKASQLLQDRMNYLWRIGHGR